VISIDEMTPADWSDVARIYREGLATGLATFEVEAPSWEAWNAGHLPSCRLVARDDGRVCGWVALSPVSTRQCYAGVAEFSVYVAEAARNRGVGQALMTALIHASEQAGIWTLQSATFATNHASLRLQERCGFRVIGRRERIAQRLGTWHDTVLTERRSRAVAW
jgi:phosphinothricin acetyltransferase